MKTRIILLLAAMFLAVIGVARAEAREVHMIAPEIPPHFDKSGHGRIADVVRAALERCGHRVRFTVVPFGRHWKDYADQTSFDGLATAEADQTFPGYSTKPFMRLQDGATVRGAGGLEAIASVDQLKGMRVLAFPAADKILGIEALVPQFKSFGMRADRFDQLRPLFADRADAVLADGLITANFIMVLRDRARAGLEPSIDPTSRVVFRKIFASGPQRLYFRDAVIAADFDRCVGELRTSGELVRIAKPYVDQFRDILGDQYPDD
ncbi:MAG: ABC transporter substrate-binding protein [Rhodospirillales bacterium]|nr:ABC transporter substrate-binding protein [Rhodospirillales bacterium]